MRILDDYLDSYLARKIVVQFERHFGKQNIQGIYDSVLREYTINYMKELRGRRLLQFKREESLIVLRDLLAEGWGKYDSLAKSLSLM